MSDATSMSTPLLAEPAPRGGLLVEYHCYSWAGPCIDLADPDRRADPLAPVPPRDLVGPGWLAKPGSLCSAVHGTRPYVGDWLYGQMSRYEPQMVPVRPGHLAELRSTARALVAALARGAFSWSHPLATERHLILAVLPIVHCDQ